MHPIFSNRRRLATYMLAWAPVGLLLAIPLVRQEGSAWPEALATTLPLTALYAFVCLAAWYSCRALPLGTTPVPRLLIAHATAAALSALLWTLAGIEWAVMLARISEFEFAGGRFARSASTVFASGLLLFLLSVAVHYMMIAFEESRATERRSHELVILAREAELQSLRAQVNPHFLFNALNSIAALTSSDPAGARRMCISLSDFLRKSLDAGSRERITLDEELALATDYLVVEQIRFGGRLKVEAWVDRSAGRCVVPPLLLQPLVENAVKHGIAHLLDGGTIRIEARLDAGRLLISLSNPCDPDRSGKGAGPGVGLSNVRRRVAAAHGDAGRVEAKEQDGRFEVRVSLPVT